MVNVNNRTENSRREAHIFGQSSPEFVKTNQNSFAPNFVGTEPSANDDDEGLRSIFNKAGLRENHFFKIAVATGTLIGAAAFGVGLLISSWFNADYSIDVTAGHIFQIISPLAFLVMVLFLTGRLARLSSLIHQAQKTEIRIDKAGRVSALSRELEIEAAQIEARIERFLAVGEGMRQFLKRDHAEIELAFQDKIQQVKQVISQLENERITFSDEIDNINKALQISREFVGSRIGSLTSDFESAAIAAVRVLEAHLDDVTTKFSDIANRNRVQKELIEKITDNNAESISLIKNIPVVLNQKMQESLSAVHRDLEKSVDRLSAQLDTLSDHVSRSNSDLARNLSETPHQIAKYVHGLHQDLDHAFTKHGQHFSVELGQVTDRVNQLIERIQSVSADLPQQIESSLEIVEPNLAQAFDRKVQQANEKITATLRPLVESNIILNDALETAPARLQGYVATLGPLIDSKFAENAQQLEKQLNVAHEQQLAVGRELIAKSKTEFESVVNSIPNFGQHLGKILETNIGELESQIRFATSSIQALFEQHKQSIDFNNQSVLENVNRSALEQLKQVGDLIDASWSNLQDKISSSFSQQELRSKDFETGFRSLIDDFKMAKNDVSSISSDLSASIQGQMKIVEDAMDVMLHRFNSSLVSNQDLAVKNMSGQLATTQQNLSNEYNLIESRLFRSLNNFNEVVKNCITSLDEASNWRLKTFEEKIKSASDENLSSVRKEFEELAERMRIKISELRLDANIPSDERERGNIQHGYQSYDESDLEKSRYIEELEKKLGAVDSILRELKGNL